MTKKGFMYVHPYWKNSVIDAFYSEPGTEGEVDGSLDPPGQELIETSRPENSDFRFGWPGYFFFCKRPRSSRQPGRFRAG